MRVSKINVKEKSGIAQIMNLWSFRTNGKAKKNNPNGIMKNCVPPHAHNANTTNNAPEIIFAKEIFPLLYLIPLKNR